MPFRRDFSFVMLLNKVLILVLSLFGACSIFIYAAVYCYMLFFILKTDTFSNYDANCFDSSGSVRYTFLR